MKVIKNINNNVSLCVDKSGRECVAFGKGIGFIKAPYEVPLDKIERTFYASGPVDIDVISDLPFEVMNVAIKIVEMVERDLGITMLSSAALALADHINFAIKRQKERIGLTLTVQEDLKHIYPNEMEEAGKALKIINDELNVKLDENEAGTIALHILNSEIGGPKSEQTDSQKIVDECVRIVEDEFNIHINRKSFSYSRFATHVDYLLRRACKNAFIQSENAELYTTLRTDYPKTHHCVKLIAEMFEKKYNFKISQEEKLYLMIHVNRLQLRGSN